MYVNDWTVDYGPRGREAVRTLLERAAEAGLVPGPLTYNSSAEPSRGTARRSSVAPSPSDVSAHAAFAVPVLLGPRPTTLMDSTTMANTLQRPHDICRWTTGRFRIYKLDALKPAGLDVTRLPFSLQDPAGKPPAATRTATTVTADDIMALADWDPKAIPSREIAFRPSRVLLQDFTGVPAVVDLAAMRDAMKRMGGDPKKINPLQPVELVIDHSVQVDEAGTLSAFRTNAELEFQPQPRAVRLPPLGPERASRTSGSSRPTPGSSTR